METKVRRTTLKDVGNRVLEALGMDNDATETSSWARLKSIMGIRGSEGFFADGVILVEGTEDEAAIGAFAEYKRVSLDAAGICIIPAEGKTKLPSLLALYQCLGIDVYLVFDADCDQSTDEKAKVNYNKALLSMIGESPEARPETKFVHTGTVWKTNFLDEVREAFGKEKWEAAFTESCNEFSVPSDQAKKKYAVIWRTVELLLKQELPCEPLKMLWKFIAERFNL
jgi:predicted ATP-dependent endonuclease of OLD family